MSRSTNLLHRLCTKRTFTYSRTLTADVVASSSRSTGLQNATYQNSSSGSGSGRIFIDQSVSYSFKPQSPSYFTGNAVYNDNLLKLEALVRRYQKLPEYPLGQYPKTYWRSIEQYKEIDDTSKLRPTDHKRLIQLLNKLNRIDREYMPGEVQEVITHFTRERLGADPIKRVLVPDEFGRSFGVGRRKESVSRVWAVPGTGEIYINGKSLPTVFPRLHDRESVLLPLIVTERSANYNIWAYVDGGGTTGQAGAIQLGLARAMLVHEPDLKPVLRKAGCVTADKRRVERKKTGQPGARAKYTWVCCFTSSNISLIMIGKTIVGFILHASFN